MATEIIDKQKGKLKGKLKQTMREIKFRGIRIDNGEWVYGDYHHRVGNVHCIICMEPDDNGKVVYVVHQVNAETVGSSQGCTTRTVRRFTRAI